MNKYFPYLLVALMILASSRNLLAQEKTIADDSLRNSPNLFWLTAGAGVAVRAGLSAIAEATYSWNSLTLGLKYSIVGFLTEGPIVNQFGINYGSLSLTPSTIVRCAAGPCVLSDGESIRPGIEGEAEAMLKGGPIGLSVMASLVLTSKYTYLGLTLNLSVGKLY